MKFYSVKSILLNAFHIILGIFSAGLGLKGFLLSSHFIDGGVTGISMLLSKSLGLPLFLLIPLINLPFIFIGWKQIGGMFAIKSMLAIAGLALVIAFVHFPDVTQDKLLTAIFGGIFLGAGIGLAIRGGSVLDGTEIAALLLSKALPSIRLGDVILTLNIFIFACAILVLGVEPALYSVLTYMSASKMIDFLIHGVEEYTGIIIVSTHSNAIRQAITHELKRGLTVYKGAGGLTGELQDILFCVVTRLEIGKIKSVTRHLDPAAFIIVHPLAEAENGFTKTVLHRSPTLA